MRRPGEEDLTAQRDAVTTAHSNLHDALSILAGEAALAAKVARRKGGQPDLPAVYAAANAVRRAEEALDTATYDLSTASGEHG